VVPPLLNKVNRMNYLSKYAWSDISISVISFNLSSNSVTAVDVCKCLLVLLSSFIKFLRVESEVVVSVESVVSSTLISPIVRSLFLESTVQSVSSLLPSSLSSPVPLGHFVGAVDSALLSKNSSYAPVEVGQ